MTPPEAIRNLVFVGVLSGQSLGAIIEDVEDDATATVARVAEGTPVRGEDYAWARWWLHMTEAERVEALGSVGSR